MEKRAQVWVETVIYTLMGLAVIGILLSVSRPKIDEMKDKLVIEQTIKSLNTISEKIYEVQIAPGNKRVLSLKVTKGTFFINSSANKIGWILESGYKYSELDEVVPLGNMEIVTRDGNPYVVYFSMNYGANLTYNNKEDYAKLEGSPSPYNLIVESKPASSGSNVMRIDLSVS